MFLASLKVRRDALFEIVQNVELFPRSLLRVNFTGVAASTLNLKLSVSSPLKRYVRGSEVPAEDRAAI
jgi:hypothetical protein